MLGGTSRDGTVVSVIATQCNSKLAAFAFLLRYNGLCSKLDNTVFWVGFLGETYTMQ